MANHSIELSTNTQLFLKWVGGWGRGFSREKKFSPSPGTIYPYREQRVSKSKITQRPGRG